MRTAAGARSTRITLGALTALALGFAAAAEAGLPREFSLRRPGQAAFYTDYNDNGTVDRIWGLGATTDVALLADVDGDTLADAILFRGGAWFVDLRNNQTIDLQFYLGGGADIPVVGDFLGDGRAGFGVFRPSDGRWYLDRNGDFTVDFVSPWGTSGDVPVVADYDGDGRADRAVYRAGAWYVDLGLDGTLDALYYLGGAAADQPIAGDFDGDWKADNAVFRNGLWYMDYGNNSTVDRVLSFGATGDRPLYANLNPGSSLFVRLGATGGNGSQAAPFGTIAAALAAAVPGQIIRIAAGLYNEGVCFANRQNLTFVGAGVSATRLRGANNNGCNNSLDAFAVLTSQGIVLRNLRVATPNTATCSPATACARGIVAYGIPTPVTLTLDRVTTIANRGHGVLAVGTSANPSTLIVESSNLDRSRMGNGLRLEGGVNATVRRSTIDNNGTTLPVDANSGRGVEAFADSTLLMEYSSSSDNYHSALLFTGTSTGVVRYSTLDRNGHSAVFFEQGSSGDVYGNVMDDNGILGTPGPTTGFNAIEIYLNWTGPQMLIHENIISRATTTGIFIHRGTVTLANNHLLGNFVGIALYGSVAPINANVWGNTFELPLAQGNEEGLFIQRDGAAVSATVGGATAALRNTFINYIGNPSIHCWTGTEAVTCPAGGNTFVNSDLPISGCPATCVP
jgi:hypothetical protein